MKQFESFFWGIIAALGAGVVQFVFFILFATFADPTSNLSYAQFFAIPVFIATTAFIEELFKYLLISKRILEHSSERNFLLNAFLFGLGFFAVEFALILASSPTLQLPTTAGIAALHLGTTIFMSFFIATRSSKGSNFSLLALLLATILHVLYNLAIAGANQFSGYFAIALLIILLFIDLKLFLRFNQELAQD